MTYESDFFAIGVTTDDTVYNWGFTDFCMGEIGTYGVDFYVFLILGREKRFVNIGSFHTREIEGRIKFGRFITDLSFKEMRMKE